MKECFICKNSILAGLGQKVHVCNECFITNLIDWFRDNLHEARTLEELRFGIDKLLIEMKQKISESVNK